MQYGLIGEHLPHSFSKIIHEDIGLYEYELHEVAKEDIDSFMKQKDFKAINVTIPYKQTVIPYLDEISERAEAIGAVNTIVNREGKLFGDNTDFGGMLSLIDKMGLELSGKKVLILGTGGTSRTAFAVAKSMDAKEIHKVSRVAKEGSISYEEMYEKHADADIIINTTPCGMFPDTYKRPVDLERFSNIEGVVDAIYNPLSSMLVQQAKELGAKAQGGLYMLVAQAVLAAEIFTDQILEEDLIDKIYGRLLARKRNIVLIGLPSSGKTTAGKRLAEITGRKLIDSDDVIIERESVPISEIFAKRGEKAFRDIESEVIAEISKENGVIIATGGGAVLRKENVEALKTNGIIVFLDRNPDTLIPTDDRPTFDAKEKIKELYRIRYPIYSAAADIHFKADCGYEEAGDAVYRLVNEF
ncbi:MAG TPA: shikimate dehydrogenase [Candidatus Alectryocaccobium stercorigallinarum]|nr:shikimate dehydrogenase [Candidatus Alectryocaccobium stercorigallinarum]